MHGFKKAFKKAFGKVKTVAKKVTGGKFGQAVGKVIKAGTKGVGAIPSAPKTKAGQVIKQVIKAGGGGGGGGISQAVGGPISTIGGAIKPTLTGAGGALVQQAKAELTGQETPLEKAAGGKEKLITGTVPLGFAKVPTAIKGGIKGVKEAVKLAKSGDIKGLAKAGQAALQGQREAALGKKAGQALGLNRLGNLKAGDLGRMMSKQRQRTDFLKTSLKWAAGGTISIMGVSGIGTWLAADNRMGTAAISFRDLAQSIPFNENITSEMVDEQYQTSRRTMEQSQKFIKINTMLNPSLWGVGKNFNAHAKEQITNLDSMYQNALLALEDKEQKEMEGGEEGREEGGFDLEALKQRDIENQQFQTDLQTRKEEAQQQSQQAQQQAQQQSQQFWSDYQANKPKPNVQEFIQQGGQFSDDPAENDRIEEMLRRKALGLGLKEEEQDELKQLNLWDQNLAFLLKVRGQERGGSGLGFGLLR